MGAAGVSSDDTIAAAIKYRTSLWHVHTDAASASATKLLQLESSGSDVIDSLGR